ncbi:MAG: hypothetical protein L0177_08170 [Chloroflexi bacterium]|nr:hypothetical protein [Chloroflexota bacterium]
MHSKRKKELEKSLQEVKATADKLLSQWAGLAGEEAHSFVSNKLNQLAQRRGDLERGIAEVDEALAGVKRRAVKSDEVRRALASVREVYECLKPFEQKELMQLVLRGAEVSERQMALEIDSSIATMAKPPEGVNHTGKLGFEPPNWLRR